MSSEENTIKWSDIDKIKFYGIGTGIYTAITLGLHPISVIKTRQQVLNNVASNALSHLKKKSTRFHFAGLDKISGLYRGVGIILLLAIPARGIYIYTLETSREVISGKMTQIFAQKYSESDNPGTINRPLVASFSGGLAGGIAAASAQMLVVPMDIISQKQMVMDSVSYERGGSITNVMKSVIQGDGWKGFYRGFGLSLFASLPTGTIWWATYSGCQHSLQSATYFHGQGSLYKTGFIQLVSGLSAATLAATLTQPLDVLKTRLQVGNDIGVKKRAVDMPTYSSITKELIKTHGYRGLFRGTAPRILNIALWGTILSSAYEYLRHVSRKDYEFLPINQSKK